MLRFEVMGLPLIPAPEFWERIEGEVASRGLSGRSLRNLLSVLRVRDAREVPQGVEGRCRYVRDPGEWVWAGATVVGAALRDLFGWEWRRELEDPREALGLVVVRRLTLEALHGFLREPGLEWALEAAVLGSRLLARDAVEGRRLGVPQRPSGWVGYVPGEAADALRSLGVGLFRLEVGACALAVRVEGLEMDAEEVLDSLRRRPGTYRASVRFLEDDLKIGTDRRYLDWMVKLHLKSFRASGDGGLSRELAEEVREELERVKEIADRLTGDEGSVPLEDLTLRLVREALEEGRRLVVRGERVPDEELDSVFVEWMKATERAGISRRSEARSGPGSWAELAERLREELESEGSVDRDSGCEGS